MSSAALMTLAVAAKKYGLPSASTIKTEAKRGNVVLTRLAGRLYVTDEAMQGMFEKCRENYSPPASTCGPAKGVNPSMSLKTENTSIALDSALHAAKMLKKPLAPTS